MTRFITALFVFTLAISVGGGLLLVAAQVVGLIAGAAPLTETLNSDIKPWLVVISAVCAMFSFVLMYIRGDAKEQR